MRRPFFAFICVFFLVASAAPSGTVGQSTSEMQEQISEYNRQLEELDKEIAKFEKELANTTTKKQSLQNTISQLNIQRKKITTSIGAIKKRIAATELEIRQLARGIATKEESIERNRGGLVESLRRLNEQESLPFVLQLLSSKDITAAWEDMDALSLLRVAVVNDIEELSTEKKALASEKQTEEQKRTLLRSQQSKLVSEQGSLDATRRAQSELLSQTKAQESEYQKILREKQAAKAAFESALSDLKDKLQYTVDPSKIPARGKGILQWPLENVRLTQEFGDTAFARSGAYSGKGHNGIDLAASIGTPVKAALTGVVKGTGDTGSVKGCYSYGRWALVRHNNGLDTLYAHLSQISVSSGQAVSTGDVIGYAGQTGYATGPHLHFGVYASSATQIMRLGDATNRVSPCANALMPIAPLSGYLDPMSYL